MNKNDIVATIIVLILISITIGLITLFISAAFILAPIVAIGFGVYLVHMFVIENSKTKKKKRKH